MQEVEIRAILGKYSAGELGWRAACRELKLLSWEEFCEELAAHGIAHPSEKPLSADQQSAMNGFVLGKDAPL